MQHNKYHVSAVSLVTLAACNNNNKASGDSSSNAKTENTKFASDVTNRKGTAIKGGTVNYAMVPASIQRLINPIIMWTQVTILW